jgi:hypothetical protein
MSNRAVSSAVRSTSSTARLWATPARWRAKPVPAGGAAQVEQPAQAGGAEEGDLGDVDDHVSGAMDELRGGEGASGGFGGRVELAADADHDGGGCRRGPGQPDRSGAGVVVGTALRSHEVSSCVARVRSGPEEPGRSGPGRCPRSDIVGRVHSRRASIIGGGRDGPRWSLPSGCGVCPQRPARRSTRSSPVSPPGVGQAAPAVAPHLDQLPGPVRAGEYGGQVPVGAGVCGAVLAAGPGGVLVTAHPRTRRRPASRVPPHARGGAARVRAVRPPLRLYRPDLRPGPVRAPTRTLAIAFPPSLPLNPAPEHRRGPPGRSSPPGGVAPAGEPLEPRQRGGPGVVQGVPAVGADRASGVGLSRDVAGLLRAALFGLVEFLPDRVDEVVAALRRAAGQEHRAIPHGRAGAPGGSSAVRRS